MCKGKCTLPQQFKGDTEVITKVEVFLHVDDIVSIIFVFLQQSIKDLHFYQSLAVKSGISHDMEWWHNSGQHLYFCKCYKHHKPTVISAGGTMNEMFHSTLLTTVILISYDF